MERIGHYTQLPDGWCYATIKEVFIINPKIRLMMMLKWGLFRWQILLMVTITLLNTRRNNGVKLKLVLLISQMETLQLRKYLLVWRIGNR